MVGRIHALIILLLILALSSVSALCQALPRQPTETDFILSCNPIKNNHEKPHIHKHDTQNPGLRTLFLGAIRFYQKFVSTQDAPSCNFVPSCSQFGVESIRLLGFARGILLTSDRLQRCNSLSISRYETDHKSGLLIDPVRLYQKVLK